MRPQLLAIVGLIASCEALKAPVFNSSGIFNDHYEDALARIIRTGRTPNGSPPLPAKRTIIQSLVPQIDAAIAGTADLTHYFWTGNLPPFRTTGEDSVGPAARAEARRMHGTTLEDNVESFLPGFAVRDQDTVDTWTYASQQYAMAASGVVYVIRGEMTRPNNVFDTQELPILQANPAVTAIYQINAHLSGFEQPTLIWPPNPGPMLTQTTTTAAVATACYFFSRNGLWPHSTGALSLNTRVSSPYGYYYGGEASTNNPGAFTYSFSPQLTTTRVTQSSMATWVNGGPNFDAQFPTSTAWQPTAINYGQGWLPYETACPLGNDIDHMGGLKIRGLPLGDSITFGFQSTDGTGYRLVLQDLIDNPPWVTNPDPSRKRQSGDGSIVDYIGSVDSGAMPDPENEGHSGAEIAEISTFVAPDLAENPNVVFLLAGTNDINNGDDDADAPTRLMAIVDQITSTLPDTVVLVGSIPLNGNADLEPAVDAFNQAVNQAVLVRFADGARVMTVSMYDIGPEDMADGLHPNDAGYALMASRWFGGFWQAAQWGWIDPATGDLGGTGPERNFCPTNPVWFPQGEIANGAGLGPNGGTYDCLPVGELGSTGCTCSFTEPNVPVVQFPTPPSGQCSDLNDNSTAVRFADLNGDGREEYLWLDIDGATTAFLNLGSTAGGTDAGQVQWLPSGVIATGVGARRDQVRFADLNGDGRAEYLFVHDDGSVDAWLNLGGPDDGPEAAKVSWFPAGTIATGIGQDGAGVRFADLNGDGRAEYLWIDENGAMTAYLNLGAPSGGTGAANVQWLPQGVVATGPANGATRDNVILADINGDGKADYITVTHDGGVASLFINGGGPDDGPNAAKVVWFPQGVVATGVGTSGVGVQFADLDGDGRADYVDVDYLTSAVNAWLNGCQ